MRMRVNNDKLTRLHWALEGRGVWDRRSRQVTRYAVDVRVAELVRLVQARRCQDVRLVRARDKDSWGFDSPLHRASKAVYSCSGAPRVVQMRLIRTFVIPSFLGCYECRTCGIRPGASPAWCGRQCSGHFRFDTTLAGTKNETPSCSTLGSTTYTTVRKSCLIVELFPFRQLD